MAEEISEEEDISYMCGLVLVVSEGLVVDSNDMHR